MLKSIYNDSLLRNSICLIMTNFSGLILGFFFWMIAARYYTPNDIGTVSVLLSSISLISMISLIGLPVSLTFYLPTYRKNANRIINTCMIIGVIISTIISLIFILELDILVPKLKSIFMDSEIIIIFIVTTIMTTVSLLMPGIFTAGKRSSFLMIKENIFGFTKIFSLILFTSFGTIGILLSWSIGLAIALIIGFFLMYKLWRYIPTLTFDPIIKNMASFSIGNYISGLFYSLPKLIFPIIIASLISTESAGYFFIAMTMAGLLYTIPQSITGPFLTESSDKEKFWNNVNKSIKFTISLLIPGLLLFIIFGRFVLSIFNQNYADNSFATLIILSVTSIPLSLITIFVIVRNAQKRMMTTIKINGIVTVMTIVLSIPLMRIWNIEGAAIAYLIANTIVATGIIFRIKDPKEFTYSLMKNAKKSDNVVA